MTTKYNIGDTVWVIKAPYYHINMDTNQKEPLIYLYDISNPIPNKKLYWMKDIYIGNSIINEIFIDRHNKVFYKFDHIMYYDFGVGWEQLPENAVYSSKEEAEKALKGYGCSNCNCCKFK